MKKFVIILLILVSGCKKERSNVSFFFTPDGSQRSNKRHIILSIMGKPILDTTFKDDLTLDKSELIKCLNLNKPTSILVIFNDQRRLITISPSNLKDSCLSVFLKYDEMSKLKNRFQAYTKELIKKSGEIPDYKTFADRVRMDRTQSMFYDSILVVQKVGRCWCADSYEAR